MSLAKKSLLFAIGTFLSRISGVIRESVLAGAFGANFLLDTFIIANRIPNLLRELLAEGALGASFTQVFSKLKEKDPTRARLFLIQSFYFFTLITTLFCIFGILFAPGLVKAMTFFSTESTTHPEFFHDTVGLTRVLFPFIALMTIGSIASGVLHQKSMFFLSAISSVALNIGYIIGALCFAPLLVKYSPDWVSTYVADKMTTGLALGVLLGGFCQTAIQLAGIWRSELSRAGLAIRGFWSEDLRNVCGLMGPMIIAGSAGQVNVLVNTNFASSLQEGSVTWLNFSFRILQLPIGIFAVGVGLISLPALTKAIARKNSNAEVTAKLQEALSLVLWLVVPCLCFLLVNSLPVTQLLYQHGKFTAHDSIATGEALYYYSFSLIAYGLLKVLTSYYYASERTSFAMRMSIVSIVVNFALNSLFINSLGHKGLALTTSCTLSLNALFLIWGLKRDALAWQTQKLLRTLGLLILGFLLALGAQKLCQPLLSMTAMTQNLALKWQALIMITVNGTIVCAFFGSGWLLKKRLGA